MSKIAIDRIKALPSKAKPAESFSGSKLSIYNSIQSERPSGVYFDLKGELHYVIRTLNDYRAIMLVMRLLTGFETINIKTAIIFMERAEGKKPNNQIARRAMKRAAELSADLIFVPGRNRRDISYLLSGLSGRIKGGVEG